MKTYVECRCGWRKTLGEFYAGKLVRCPSCRTILEAPRSGVVYGVEDGAESQSSTVSTPPVPTRPRIPYGYSGYRPGGGFVRPTPVPLSQTRIPARRPHWAAGCAAAERKPPRNQEARWSLGCMCISLALLPVAGIEAAIGGGTSRAWIVAFAVALLGALIGWQARHVGKRTGVGKAQGTIAFVGCLLVIGIGGVLALKANRGGERCRNKGTQVDTIFRTPNVRTPAEEDLQRRVREYRDSYRQELPVPPFRTNKRSERPTPPSIPEPEAPLEPGEEEF